MYRLNDILAKSKSTNFPKGETLVEHTNRVIKIWEQVKERYAPALDVDNDFWQQSFMSVLFHDFGKIAQNFQDVINGTVKNYDHYVRHELVSGVLLFCLNPQLFKQYPWGVLAVFSHHKPFNEELFLNGSDTVRIDFDTSALNELIDYCNQKLGEKGLHEIDVRVASYIEATGKKFDSLGNNGLYNLFNEFARSFRQNFQERKYRKDYVFHKAVLHIADWTASGHESLLGILKYDATALKNKIIFKLEKEGKQVANFTYRKFQTDSILNGHILAIAPTGSGKTEAALLWASQKNDIQKILYLLPTRVTSNAIYERLKTYFGDEHCAVIHSSAFFYRKTIEDTFEKKDYLKDKTFFRNVNICTIDQVLTQGFNLGYWELKTFHCLNARIIIDEIHLYQPYTLGLIIATIQYLKDEFGTKFYIMTATMPQKLKDLLQKTLGINDHHIISDTELLNNARNAFEVRDCLIDDLDDEIKEALRTYNKILIVANTIDEAIRLYEKYKNDKENVICFHSRFIQKDRLKKERTILDLEKQNEPMLLIATQVVEVSLDIDFDILFTENAPMDAIIQRAGRVNRKRDAERNSKVIVFRHREVVEKYVYKDAVSVLHKTFKLLLNNQDKLTEEKLLSLTDKAYEGIEIESNDSYLTGLRAYTEIQNKRYFIEDSMSNPETLTRDIDTITVIPEKFETELKNASPMEKASYELSIHKNKQYKYPIKEGFIQYTKYNDTIGLTFNRVEDKNQAICF